MMQAKLHNYSIEAFNFVANRWEIVDTARTFDEAFDTAEKYFGFHKDYDEVAILDMMGYIVWSSESMTKDRMKNVGQAEQQYVAPDGSC